MTCPQLGLNPYVLEKVKWKSNGNALSVDISWMMMATTLVFIMQVNVLVCFNVSFVRINLTVRIKVVFIIEVNVFLNHACDCCFYHACYWLIFLPYR